MTAIKGLMIKDLLQLKSYKRMMIVYIIIFTCSAIAQSDAAGIEGTLIIMFAFGFGMFSTATFSYDEMAKSDGFILTLPTTKKDLVISKYILVIVLTTIGAILGVMLSIIIITAIYRQFPNIIELLVIGTGSILGMSFVESVRICCIYKYGVTKGRMLILIITAIAALLVGGIIYVGINLNIELPSDVTFSNILVNFLPIIFIATTAIIYYISYKVSYKIYIKKEI